MDYNWTNCSKVIKAEVNTLLLEFPRLLDDHLLGIYLYGSLASGGFNPERSNINLLVLTDHPLEDKVRHQVATLLLRMSRVPAPLDCIFAVKQETAEGLLPITLHYHEKVREEYQRALRSDNEQPPNGATSISNDQQILAFQALRTDGICLYGQSIADAIPQPSAVAFRNALIHEMQAELEHPLHDPIAFVLNGCRAMAYLRSGSLLSKRDAAIWGLTQLPEQYHSLIQQAQALYQGERLGRPVGRATLDNFAQFLQETFQQAA
ncbi:streptomycin 3''-adenylyltransferase [Dictyobacter alpinus]|uniref:Streptomycin 3''-adenylyltransferase n=1 Tax=Dictyobacter alpinus TaxID=2014873 RepID=A0A402BJF9_9CHLR|nr:aminoglycoside adenylyltransferase domain-containing protein [Dictyobacter alpinus]GCE31476.1 streptomycin 3''-adenylyltransferase [Dictyobacter alpinus]